MLKRCMVALTVFVALAVTAGPVDAFPLAPRVGWWPLPPLPHCAVQNVPTWYDWICHPYHGSDAPPKPPNPGKVKKR